VILKQCANYRTTALVSHASYWIILERIQVKTETEIADEQVGLLQGRGRDQITNLRILMHQAREHQQPLYMAKLYRKQLAEVKVAGPLAELFSVKNPTRSCPFSVLVQHPIAEMVMRETLDRFQGGL